MKYKKILKVIVFIFIIASISILIGFFFNSLSKPTTISSYAIDKTQDITTYYLFNNDLNLKDNIKIEGNVDFDLDSEYYKNRKEEIKKYNLIKNLTNLDTNFTIEQNKTKKEALITLKEKLKEEKILDTKLYITNSTEYYYVDGVLNNYINNGTCNYFETLNKSNTTKDNIDYIYKFIFKSLKNNLKEEYFETKEIEESINGKSKKVHEVSIEVDNDLLITVLNNILKDLKNDKKANSILTNIDEDFKKIKIKDNTKILDKDEIYDIHIYTSNILYKPLKYKIIHNYNNKKEEYIYETNTKKFYYIEDNSIKYIANINIEGNNITIKIYDSMNKEIGEFKISKNNNDISITYDIVYDNKKIDLVYSSKIISNKNNNYKNDHVLSFKYIENKESKLNGSIKLNLNINDNPKIMEDIGEVTLKSKLTETQNNILKTKKDKIKERLEK